MRWLRMAAVIGLMLVGAGCANAIGGVAVAPPGTRGSGTVSLTSDGYGYELGSPGAPTAIEIFTEPQCPACARLQMFHGSEMAQYIDRGDLLVTYRPVAFLDTSPAGYSHMVINAMFLAVEPDAGIPAAAVQDFIQELYWQADPSRDDQYLASIASTARLPQDVIDRIAAGRPAVDAVAVDNTNRSELGHIGPIATPTVYNLNTDEVVDTSDHEWLKNLIGAYG